MLVAIPAHRRRAKNVVLATPLGPRIPFPGRTLWRCNGTSISESTRREKKWNFGREKGEGNDGEEMDGGWRKTYLRKGQGQSAATVKIERTKKRDTTGGSSLHWLQGMQRKRTHGVANTTWGPCPITSGSIFMILYGISFFFFSLTFNVHGERVEHFALVWVSGQRDWNVMKVVGRNFDIKFIFNYFSWELGEYLKNFILHLFLISVSTRSIILPVVLWYPL